MIRIIGLLGAVLSMQLHALTNADELKIKSLMNNSKIEEALMLIKSIDNLTPDPKLNFIKGVALARNKENIKAIKVFESIVKDFPEHPEAYNNLAVLYAKEGRLDEAIIVLEQAIKTNESYSTAYLNLGDLYSKKAANVYGEVLKIDSKNNIAINKLRLIDEFFNYEPVAMEAKLNKSKINDELKNSKKDEKLLVNEKINEWKDGWKNKNYEQYFNAYSQSFEYPVNMSRNEWKRYRKERIQFKKSIEIKVKDLVIFRKKELYHATFTQEYKSENFSENSSKLLVLSFSKNEWKIIKEISY